MVILVAAGLFLRTLSNLQSIYLGFNSEQLLTVQSFLFGMKRNDPLALAAAVLTMAAATLLGGYVPAHNASRIEPMAALRHE